MDKKATKRKEKERAAERESEYCHMSVETKASRHWSALSREGTNNE